MTSVILQQVSSPYARNNAEKTLHHPISLNFLKDLGVDEAQKLEAMCPSGHVFVWGSKSERVHQYGKMPPLESLVLFRRNQTVYKCGIVVQWVWNPRLAERLWGSDASNETWGLIYFLCEIYDVSIAASEINQLIIRKATDNWRGMVAIDSIAEVEKVVRFVKKKLQEGVLNS